MTKTKEQAPENTEKRSHKHSEGIECERCKWRIPFQMPPEIVGAYRIGKLVIFAGAGVSTENKRVFPDTFADETKAELNLPKEKQIAFSKLMSLYSSPPRNRKDLIIAIKKRIDYVKSFPELYKIATEFHRELSIIPHLDEIFTTNWDDFFERECDATPIVTGEDFAIMLDTSVRKVFKLHGSVYNFGSIIATEEDYRKCYKELSTGIVGANLKLHLVSRTIVFVGFSFDDEDFRQLYRFLLKNVKGIIPKSYVVTLDKNAKKKLKQLKINATPIITSAAFFVEELKKELVEKKLMLPEERYKGIKEAIRAVIKEHIKLNKLDFSKHPDVIFSVAYQDGLLHSFERLLAKKKSGEYSCVAHVGNLVNSYDSLIKEKIHRRNYADVAYFAGYMAGLVYFLSDNKSRNKIPKYFLFTDNEVMDFEQCLREEKNAPMSHKSAHKEALRITKRLPKGFVYHHTPFS